MDKKNKIKDISNIIKNNSKVESNYKSLQKCKYCNKPVDDVLYWISDSCRNDLVDKICEYLGLKVYSIVEDILRTYFGDDSVRDFHNILAKKIVNKIFL